MTQALLLSVRGMAGCTSALAVRVPEALQRNFGFTPKSIVAAAKERIAHARYTMRLASGFREERY